MKNPCDGEDNIRDSSTIFGQNRKCTRRDDKLYIEMNNEMSIDAVNYLGTVFEIKLLNVCIHTDCTVKIAQIETPHLY